MTWLRALVSAALAAALAAPAAAQDYSDVFVFGDSLSDTGSFCSGTELLRMGYDGVCSNGDVWSEIFAEAVGETAEPFPTEPSGTNFAFGTADVSDFDLQIDELRARILPDDEVDSDALVVIWMGGNDILDMPDETAARDAAREVADAVEEIADLGAEQFLVVNLPDLGRVYGSFAADAPASEDARFTPAERELLTQRTKDFNDELDAQLDAFGGALTLHRLDVFALFESVIANPEAFGFVPAAIDATPGGKRFAFPCLLDDACADDPQGPIADGFVLFDALHPTTAAHAEIAERAVRAVPEPGAGAAALAALGSLAALAAHRRRDARGAAGARPR